MLPPKGPRFRKNRGELQKKEVEEINIIQALSFSMRLAHRLNSRNRSIATLAANSRKQSHKPVRVPVLGGLPGRTVVVDAVVDRVVIDILGWVVVVLVVVELLVLVLELELTEVELLVLVLELELLEVELLVLVLELELLEVELLVLVLELELLEVELVVLVLELELLEVELLELELELELLELGSVVLMSSPVVNSFGISPPPVQASVVPMTMLTASTTVAIAAAIWRNVFMFKSSTPLLHVQSLL